MSNAKHTEHTTATKPIDSDVKDNPQTTQAAIDLAKENIGADLVDILTMRAVKRISNIIVGAIGAGLLFAGWIGFEVNSSKEQLVANVTSQLEILDKKVAPISTQLSEFQTDINRMKRGAGSIDARHEKIGETFSNLEQDMNQFTLKLDSLGERIAAVESAREYLRSLYVPVLGKLSSQELALNDFGHVVQRAKEDYEAVKVAIAKELNSVPEHQSVTLQNGRESQFGAWPIRVFIGRFRSGVLERVRVKSVSGTTLALREHVEENGTPMTFESKDYEYTLHFSNINSGGVFKRNTVINATRNAKKDLNSMAAHSSATR